jgi:hypothetical protein
MTRFKKELVKRNVMLEETLPYLPYGNVEAIVVHSDTCTVSIYDNRIGWYFHEYNRNMIVEYQWDEDDIQEDGTINKVLVNREY